jgi:hypothetical protein
LASIDLPRAIRDYFAFAETTATRNGRRFCITLPYVRPDGRLDKLQWWYHLSAAKEKALGDHALDALRAEAIRRFRVHIERWLQNTAQVIYGEGTIPQVSGLQEQRLPATAAIANGAIDNGAIDIADTPAPAAHPGVIWVEADDGDPDALLESTTEKAAFG